MEPVPAKKAGIRFPWPKATVRRVVTRKPKRTKTLEKIKIGGEERRGGIDLPVNGPTDLKPRLWYAKSETSDVASSVFYFVFGGAGYTLANLAGWSAGNTRDIPMEFPYRLIRK